MTACVYTIDGPLFYYLHVPMFLPPRRVLQVLTAEQQRAFCRVGAIIRGFLTRRLLKTEKIKHLRQTVVVRLHSRKKTHEKHALKMCTVENANVSAIRVVEHINWEKTCMFMNVRCIYVCSGYTGVHTFIPD